MKVIIEVEDTWRSCISCGIRTKVSVWTKSEETKTDKKQYCLCCFALAIKSIFAKRSLSS